MMTDRQRFELWISRPPFSKVVSRWPVETEKWMWPGQYLDVNVELAWQAWQEARRY